MKLYSLVLSPYAARGAVYAKRLAVEIVELPADWPSSASFRAVAPLGRIPVLVLDDGTAIPESAVIAKYLEDAYPEPALRPLAATDLARVRSITAVADLYVTQALMLLIYLFDAATRDGAAIDKQFAKLEDGLGLLDSMLTPSAYVFGGRLTTTDAWLTPACLALDDLIGFAGRLQCLGGPKAVAAYAELAQRYPALGRMWHEMTEGLKDFMAARAGVDE